MLSYLFTYNNISSIEFILFEFCLLYFIIIVIINMNLFIILFICIHLIKQILYHLILIL